MQYIDLITWYLWAQAFGLGGSLITRAWLRNLPDRGYGVGKAAGLLVGGFVFWITITLGFVGNTLGTALLALASVWAIGIALNAQLADPRPLKAQLRSALPLILATELVFVLAFAGWAYVRAYSPEIIENAGEKYMEMMMINAILRAPSFPPNDAWLNGNPLSYYYFGYMLFAMLIRVSGVAPGIAFNLGGALVFALAFTAAFSVGYSLWLARKTSSEDAARLSPAALGAGLLSATMLTSMGNLGGLFGALRCAGTLPQAFWDWLNVREIAARAESCAAGLPAGWFPWWWDWSRVVKDIRPDGSPAEIISEFPIFSFILGDNHPHVIALPFVLLAVAVALSQFLYRGYARTDFRLSLSTFVLNALAIGCAGFMNTIDLPIVAAVFLAARLIARYMRGEPLVWPALTGIATVVTGYLLYLPFYVTLSSQVQGIAPSVLNATSLTAFALQFAPLALAALVLIAVATRERGLPLRMLLRDAGKLTALALLLCVGVLLLFSATSREARALVGEFQAGGAIMGLPRDQMLQQLTSRLSNTSTSVLLAGLIASCGALLLYRPASQGEGETHNALPARSHSPDQFALLLTLLGAGIVLAIEFVYIRDMFGTRMNSVFKFWYQAWLLLALAGAYAIMRALTSRTIVAKTAGGVLLVFVAAGLLFPLGAIPAKWAFAKTYVDTPTWDGFATVRRANPDDAKMIDWLNRNVRGNPVIAETPGGGYSYRGRISAFTGLPAPIGWVGHEHQWRGVHEEADRRKDDINRLYSTTDLLDAQDLLKRYQIEYVIVGATERQEHDGVTYPAEGLAKFDQLCSVAHVAGETTLFRCEQ
jgi:YYY domain-containing protein